MESGRIDSGLTGNGLTGNGLTGNGLTGNGRTRTLSALSGTLTAGYPVWLMRQAGRYLPEYRAVRARTSFLDLVHSPALCTEVALQPLRRFDLDATIVFSDILVIPDALGLGLTFTAGDGPRFDRPIRSDADVEALTWDGMGRRLSFAYDAVSSLRQAAPEHALFGFAGAPWTLYCYMVDGGGGGFPLARVSLRESPERARRVLDGLADVVANHLLAQHAAGADVVQIFDTWGGLLSAEDYAAFVMPGLRHVAARLEGVPSVLFVRGGSHLLHLLKELPFTAFSLDSEVDVATARRILGRPTQGNLDNQLLLGPADAIVADVHRIARALEGRHDHVFNLGHGIVPQTPPEAVAAFVDAVRSLP